MALTHWGFIHTAAGSGTGGDVSVVDTGKRYAPGGTRKDEARAMTRGSHRDLGPVSATSSLLRFSRTRQSKSAIPARYRAEM